MKIDVGRVASWTASLNLMRAKVPAHWHFPKNGSVILMLHLLVFSFPNSRCRHFFACVSLRSCRLGPAMRSWDSVGFDASALVYVGEDRCDELLGRHAMQIRAGDALESVAASSTEDSEIPMLSTGHVANFVLRRGTSSSHLLSMRTGLICPTSASRGLDESIQLGIM